MAASTPPTIPEFRAMYSELRARTPYWGVCGPVTPSSSAPVWMIRLSATMWQSAPSAFSPALSPPPAPKLRPSRVRVQALMRRVYPASPSTERPWLVLRSVEQPIMRRLPLPTVMRKPSSSHHSPRHAISVEFPAPEMNQPNDEPPRTYTSVRMLSVELLRATPVPVGHMIVTRSKRTTNGACGPGGASRLNTVLMAPPVTSRMATSLMMGA